MTPAHSYYPLGVEIPDYIPNERSTLGLVFTFAVSCVAVLTGAKIISTNANPRITIPELSQVLWFTLCMSFLLVTNHAHQVLINDEAAVFISFSKATTP